jgi:hypothetical protein
MSRRAAAWLAWSLWVLCVALVSFEFLASPTPPTDTLTATLRVLSLAFPTVGALVALRQPENPIGWIFCAAGLLTGVQPFASRYVDHVDPGHTVSLPGGELIDWISPWIGVPVVLLAGALFLLFPSGRLPSRRWRAVVWMAACGSAMIALWTAIRAAIGFGGGVVQVLGSVGIALLLVSLLASVTSLILRLRGAKGDERQQLKWFVYAAALMAGGTAGGLVFSTGRASLMAGFMSILGFMGLPICTGIAILKYRLYDIDILINRTLVYGSLTAALVAIYFGGIVLLQRLFVALTSQESTLAVVASTLLIAALFTPLRRSIQAFIDRRFYRRKYDARKTLEAFSAKLRDETDLDALSDDLTGVVRETMQPAHVSLWLRPDTTTTKDKQEG